MTILAATPNETSSDSLEKSSSFDLDQIEEIVAIADPGQISVRLLLAAESWVRRAGRLAFILTQSRASRADCT
jgi:hypothetical protein